MTSYEDLGFRRLTAPRVLTGAVKLEGSSSWWMWGGGLAVAVLGMTWWASVKESEKNPEAPKKERAFDRLAQRDREWAIGKYQDQYYKGRQLSKALNEAADWMADQVKKGETIVVHGRDGEVFYHLLESRPDVDMKRVKYVVSSQPLTTHGKNDPAYTDYLGRVVPHGAIHVDTGFKGSIQMWMDRSFGPKPRSFGERNWMGEGQDARPSDFVKEIRMMCALPETEIPMPELDKMRYESTGRDRTAIVGELERWVVPRLRLPRSGSWGKGGAQYSDNPHGYWAFLYGVLDGPVPIAPEE